MTRARIIGIGAYAPKRVLTNRELERMVETSDEWIVQRTGIEERRFAADDQATSDLSLEAARRALEAAGVKPEELDLIVLGTLTPDYLLPSTACLVQDRLGATNAGAFDVNAACTGFLTALHTGEAFVAAAHEPLLAIDHPAVALLHRSRLQVGGVRAGFGFRHRVGDRPLAAQRGLQVLLPLCFVAAHQRVVRPAHVGPESVRRAAGLLLDDRLFHHGRAESAQLFGYVHRPESVIERLLPDLRADRLGECLRRVDGDLVRDQLLLDEVTRSLLELLELRCQFEFQCLVSLFQPARAKFRRASRFVSVWRRIAVESRLSCHRFRKLLIS